MKKSLCIFYLIAGLIVFQACQKDEDEDDIVKDIDGNYYKTIKIGTQLWMAENLKTTKYNDGTSIPNVTDITSWTKLTTGAYCWYENNAATYQSTYGALYNWYAVNTKKLCPAKWHVPTDAEWKILEMTLGMTQAEADFAGKRGTDQGTKMKNTNGWLGNGNGNNSSGFTALPGGFRVIGGSFFHVGFFSYWWSSTELDSSNAWNRYLYYEFASVLRNSYNKSHGFSVRCLKD